MPNGFRQGRGFGGGSGFGFRGASPPWPYIGRGRGGLPRCGYFLGSASAFPRRQYGIPSYGQRPATPIYAPYSPQMTKEEELSYLKGQAEGIKGELDEIESRMHDLEAKE